MDWLLFFLTAVYAVESRADLYQDKHTPYCYYPNFTATLGKLRGTIIFLSFFAYLYQDRLTH